MRVLVLTHNYPRHAGDPVGSFVLRLAAGLKQRGVASHIVAPMAEGLTPEETLEGIPVTRFHYASPRNETLAYTGTMGAQVRGSFAAKLAMLNYLRHGYRCARHLVGTFKPDVIHAHWWFPGGLIARLLHARTRIPYVVTSHGSDIRLAAGIALAKPIFKSVARNAAAYTTVSSWLAREVGRLDPLTQAVVAPMPVAADLFDPGATSRERRILFIGKLTEQKGLQHLIRALPLMKTSARVDVVGAGRVDDAAIRSQATALGVADRITWHPLLSQAELAKLYAAAAVHVIPAIDEGLGLTAVESLLCETPVVAFNSGGLPDIVVPEETGALVPPGDAPALAATLDRVLGDESLRLRLGRQGREFALRRFGPDAAARAYFEVLANAMKSPRFSAVTRSIT